MHYIDNTFNTDCKTCIPPFLLTWDSRKREQTDDPYTTE